MNKKNLGLITAGIILLVALSRLLPHPFNFTPVGAMALFGGKFLASRYAKCLIPLAGMFVTDFIINNFIFRSFFPNHEGLIFFSGYMLWTYGAIALVVLIGWLLLKKYDLKRLMAVTMGFSLVFFLVTNFGVWFAGNGVTYPDTMSGLMACMAAGIPFFKYTLIGNLVNTPILFYAYEYFAVRALKPAVA